MNEGHITQLLQSPLYVRADKDVYAYFLSRGYEIIDDIEEIAHLKIYRVLFRIEEEDMHIIQEYVAEHPFPEEFEGFRTDHECYEVMLSGVSKGKALEDYCAMKGLTLDDAYAFGDNKNGELLARDSTYHFIRPEKVNFLAGDIDDIKLNRYFTFFLSNIAFHQL